MTAIKSLVLETPDAEAADVFYTTAFGLNGQVAVRSTDAPSEGFRGYTLSLVVSQPANVDALVGAALDAGATTLKPPSKSLWGYGGAIQAPDGVIWTIASSSKKNTGPASREFDDIVLLLGVDNVSATKQFYIGHGLTVTKSFGSKYVEFAAPDGHVKLALYKRRALAKTAGVSPEGSGSHRIVVNSDAGSFTDPDGFVWDVAPV
ncbi:glyoxalase [Cryptosporangium minutisporangium]|uniref:Glyoxalase n=1 Tax=Cryptosporangium minutisporangium TaxID=113569 RepID=A0ABP6SNV3_9ACTN